MKIKTLFYPFVIAATLLAACNEDDGAEGPVNEPPVTDSVQINTFLRDTILRVGDTLLFNADVSGSNTSIEWSLNGTVKSHTSSFMFIPDSCGQFTIGLKVSNGMQKIEKSALVTVKKYYGGFYIVNEGWLGHDGGSVNYFDIRKQILDTFIYKHNNPGLELGITTQFGAIWNNTFYFVSKQGRRFVAADAETMKDKGCIENIPDGRAFAGLSETTGVITTNNGAYKVNLNPLSLGDKLEDSDGQCGGIIADGEYVYIIHQKQGILVYNKENLSLVKKLGQAGVGFARTTDGNIWAANKSDLLRINPQSLEADTIPLPNGLSINASWGAWNAGTLCASSTENALYFGKGGMFGGGREIYKYIPGDLSSLSRVFAQGEEDDNFYGSGFRIDPQSGDIVVTFVRDGFGESYQDNRIVIFDGKNGTEKMRFRYGYYWFPALIVFK